MDNKAYDIVIIGAGASGLAAGITALEKAPGSRVVIIEKKDVPGKKICATGNGRCNLTNTACPGYIETLKFFDRAGVLTRTEEGGRVYPYSGDAKDIRDALVSRFKSLSGEIVTGSPVTEVVPVATGAQVGMSSADSSEVNGTGGYIVRTDRTNFKARMVLIAAGGKASPKLGSTGDGYRFAKSLMHSVTRLAPSLTAVETLEEMSKIAGVRAEGFVTLRENGTEKFGEQGEIQFTKYGLSGICIFNMTRYMDIPEGKSLDNGLEDYTIEIDLLPEMHDAERFLNEREGLGSGLLRSVVREPLAEYIIERAGRGAGTGEVVRTLKKLTFSPKRLKGWEFAQVTKGGVPYYEIDPDTMESRIDKGVYFAGEILDYDGPCGGFNLQHAWETGIRAGEAMGAVLEY